MKDLISQRGTAYPPTTIHKHFVSVSNSSISNQYWIKQNSKQIQESIKSFSNLALKYKLSLLSFADIISYLYSENNGKSASRENISRPWAYLNNIVSAKEIAPTDWQRLSSIDDTFDNCA